MVLQQACLEAAGGDKVSVAVVAKALGKRWEALNPEERQAYKARAQQVEAEEQPEAEPQESTAGEPAYLAICLQ